MMFVEMNPGECGFQLTSRTFKYMPPGRIRVARYSTAFMPHKGKGYYGDIYLRRLVRVCKLVVEKRRMRRWLLMAMPCMIPDLLRYIDRFL